MVIDLFGLTTEDISVRFPEVYLWVLERVKPERDLNTRASYRDKWWLFAEPQTRLFESARRMPRVLVTSRHAKHMCFAFQPPERCLSEALYVFLLPNAGTFAVLQSRIHEAWTRLLSSSLETRLRYSASDCFETFPFPQPDPRTILPALEDIGHLLYETRAKYMLDEQVGLTVTYNRLKDPAITEARIADLRRLHEELDAAVVAAYGWSDIVVPPFCIATAEDQRSLDAFETEVIDRLYALNAQRAKKERMLGPSAGMAPSKRAGATTKTDKPAQPTLFDREE